jgi:uncharacterized protein (TIGR02145 family)
MKKIIRLIALLLILFASCKKTEPPIPSPVLATITTTTPSAITSTTATSGGSTTSDGGAAITERGICYNTTTNPTTANSKVVSGNGTGSFTANMTGLTAGTIYYLRAYAINSAGTAYGNEVSFTTQGVTDVDGNVYNTVTIGTQTWMKENLKTTHYRNGDPIPNVTDNAAWITLTTGAYSNYNNDAANVATYGRLYNWYAVNDARNIAPAGWHVPTDGELNALVNYLGGVSIAGGKLKEAGTTHWASPNTGATNSSGFTALPGGFRLSTGGFFGYITQNGYIWSSTEYNAAGAWLGGVSYNSNGVESGTSVFKYSGISVRCIKD